MKDTPRKFGLMPARDYATMEKTLDRVLASFPDMTINTLEIGVHRGDTSRGIRDFFLERQVAHQHTGIDNQHDLKMEAPFPGCKFIIGNSGEVYNQVEDDSQHFIFVDGNHSLPYTLLDFIFYTPKLVRGGYIAFHDTGEHIKPFTDYQGVGDKKDPDMYIACRRALMQAALLGLTQKFTVITDEADPTHHTGGIIVMQYTKW